MKRLYRSETNRVVSGICGGVGEYFEIDPVLIRVIFLFLSFVTGLIPGLIAYGISILIIPASRDETVIHVHPTSQQGDKKDN